MPSRKPNRLIHESSPYLLQHAYNPVDWYPWGPEAFQRAQAEDKPILLSIGYSSCHWCHVMERESFENEAIANLMNRLFINIKVDREERPDLDQIYQAALQCFGRNGGWPLTMFLTPEGRPFYGGTYFPPEDRFGLPGFPRVLEAVAEAYRNRRGEIEKTGRTIVEYLTQRQQRAADRQAFLDRSLLHHAVSTLQRFYDGVHGGFGTAPKFPNPLVHALFLRHARRTGDETALACVRHSLKQMAQGGIYDQLGGGFHRYSVDERWLVPHFEKMLYDNALLARLYLETFQVTRDPFYREVAEETLAYLLRDMRDPQGGFYSAQDADSEGEEGKYYVWSTSEIRKILGAERAEWFCESYGITDQGNFEGKNILHRAVPLETVAQRRGLSLSQLTAALQEARALLLEARSRRVPPFRDEKVLTSWNALTLQALIRAYEVTHQQAYLETARQTMTFLLDTLVEGETLFHSWKAGSRGSRGYLDDYGSLILALADLFEATGEGNWLQEARDWTRRMIDQFWDEGEGDFFYTPRDHESLLFRPKQFLDQATPSATSLAVLALLRMGAYWEEGTWTQMGERVLLRYRKEMDANPFGMAGMLEALEFAVQRPVEIVLYGPQGHPGVAAMRRGIAETYIPHRILYHWDPDRPETPPPFARFAGTISHTPSAMVCHRGTCFPPLETWSALQERLEQVVREAAEGSAG